MVRVVTHIHSKDGLTVYTLLKPVSLFETVDDAVDAGATQDMHFLDEDEFQMGRVKFLPEIAQSSILQNSK